MANSVYKWDKWFSKNSFTLVRGKQYDCTTHSMSTQVRAEAKRRGVRASIETQEGDVELTTPTRLKVTIKAKKRKSR